MIRPLVPREHIVNEVQQVWLGYQNDRLLKNTMTNGNGMVKITKPVRRVYSCWVHDEEFMVGCIMCIPV
jgi:hypothetical protein